MIRARDTFLHFISDNLPNGVPLHPLRRDPSDRESDALAMNSVNVSFLNLTGGNGTAFCTQQVSVDVIFDDENVAVDCVNALFGVLTATFYTSLVDYSDPTHPSPTGTNLIWDRKRVTFKRVASEAYCHYSSLISLKFTSM